MSSLSALRFRDSSNSLRSGVWQSPTRKPAQYVFKALRQKHIPRASGTASGWSFPRGGGWDKKFQTAPLAPPAAGHVRGAGVGTKSCKQRHWHRQRLVIFEERGSGQKFQTAPLAPPAAGHFRGQPSGSLIVPTDCYQASLDMEALSRVADLFGNILATTGGVRGGQKVPNKKHTSRNQGTLYEKTRPARTSVDVARPFRSSLLGLGGRCWPKRNDGNP